jgi:hypothetical protein
MESIRSATSCAVSATEIRLKKPGLLGSNEIAQRSIRSALKHVESNLPNGASNFLKGRRMLGQDHYLAIRQFVSTSLQDAIRQSLCHDYVFLGVKLIALKKSREVEGIAKRQKVRK